MNNGFTLLELLIVIAIIGILASIILIGYNGYTDTARLANTLQWAGSMNHLLGVNAVGVWTFDNISGSTVFDDSGLGNNGTIYGATVVDGIIGKALDFNGSTDYVDVADPGSNWALDITNSLTLSAWIYARTMTGDTIISKHNGQDGGITNAYMLWFNDTTGNLDFMTRALSDNTLSVAVSVTNTWHHIVATYDGLMARIYLDGVEIASEAKTGTLATNNYGVKIGAYTRTSNPAGGFFDGLIDDVRIFKEAYTQAQVQQLYAQGPLAHQPLAQH